MRACIEFADSKRGECYAARSCRAVEINNPITEQIRHVPDKFINETKLRKHRIIFRHCVR